MKMFIDTCKQTYQMSKTLDEFTTSFSNFLSTLVLEYLFLYIEMLNKGDYGGADLQLG
jgi:hypothetical protein